MFPFSGSLRGYGYDVLGDLGDFENDLRAIQVQKAKMRNCGPLLRLLTKIHKLNCCDIFAISILGWARVPLVRVDGSYYVGW